jgi:cobalt-zinc-cadmium efflux system membrane fusion protein
VAGNWLKRTARMLSFLPTVLVLAGLALLAYAGHQRGWRLGEKEEHKTERKAEPEKEEEDKELPTETDGDYGLSSFDPTLRITHNPKLCPIDKKDIKCDEAKAGIITGAVRGWEMARVLEVTGAVEFDPKRIARVAPRAGGTIWLLDKQVGDAVKAKELLAIIDSVDVGKAKAAFAQAKVQLDLKRQRRGRLQPGVSPEGAIADADAAVREAQLNLAAAHQALLNLGLPFRLADAQMDSDSQLARRLQVLGLPKPLADALSDETTSNLLPVFNPLEVDGVVLKRDGVSGETVAPLQPILVVGDARRMMLMLDIRQEDRDLLNPGGHPRVEFTAEGDAKVTATGEIDWVGQDIDPKTRTAKARAFVDNADGRLKANSFGRAQLTVQAPKVVPVVPEEAIQWEGCSHIVFVREEANQFEVRKVELGLRRGGYVEVRPAEGKTGVKIGETIAVHGSHVLKSILFKDRLGSAEE